MILSKTIVSNDYKVILLDILHEADRDDLAYTRTNRNRQ